jgi:dTDP-4-dehydrorhamnose reductase
MRTVVVGAGGQLGAALVYEFSQGHETAGFSRSQLDINDAAAVDAMVSRIKPHVILNAAAFTDVDAAEDHPIDALNGNAFGVRVLSRAALAHGATLVHYSTDFVFDGKAAAPYTETQPPGPLGVYAASKLLGEWFALDAPTAYVLRVESLFGEVPGGPPPKSSAGGILKTLEAGGSPKVFEDRIISPSYLVDVTWATRRLLELQTPGGLYHCVNTGHCTWLEFAREMARLLGLEPRLTPVRMADAQLRAVRPLFCALSNDKLRSAGIEMPTWQDALARSIQARNQSVS